MKVGIRHREETKGTFSKRTYCVVDVMFAFSEEEKHIINQWDLSYIILERGVPADKDPSKFSARDIDTIFHLTLYRAVQGKVDSYALHNPREAKLYHQQLAERLPLLKEFIMDNAGIELKSESFEL